MPKHPGVVVAVLLAVLAVCVGGLWWWRSGTTAYGEALGDAPAATLRFSFTDWATVRERADAPRHPGPGEVGQFLDRAYEQDLTSGSPTADQTVPLQQHFGFSGLTARWEGFAQSRQGAVDVLRLSDDTDFAGLEGRLRRLGYSAPPGGPGSDGVWTGGEDLPVQIDRRLTPVTQNVAVVGSEHLVLLGDAAPYLQRAVQVVLGRQDSLDAAPATGDLTDVAGDPVAAVLYARDFACEDLSMADADASDQALADRLTQRAGDVSPLDGMVMARAADGSVTFGMEFEDADQADRNLHARVKLATGAAVGQGGTFHQRFTITRASAQDRTVRFDVRPRPGEQLLSDLGGGPVLFAAC